MLNKKQSFNGALVWIFSGLVLLLYACFGFTNTNIPGVKELVDFIQNAQGGWIYAAAFLSIFIEGLYAIGSFFPGATLVLIVAVVSSLKSFWFFVSIILTIFVGWVLAGMVNIYLATHYRNKLTKLQLTTDLEVRDRMWTTWFPSFRANYEVAQIVEGGDSRAVFRSSLRVRIWASLAAAVHTYTLPIFIDINHMSNEEGFLSVIVVAVISIIVGILKLRR